MSTNVGSIDYKLKLDTTAFDAQALAVKGKLSAIGNNINSSSKNVENFGSSGGASFGGIAAKAGIAAVAIAGVALAAKAIATPFISASIQAQDLRMQLDVLTGSADNGAKTYKKLVDMANSTPFESADLVKASSTMLAFGVSNEKLMPSLQQLGDISMGNKDRFGALSLAFSQVSATGRLMGQDLLQMVNAGFNPLQIISQKTGRSMADLKKDMEDGKISLQDVEGAMRDATSQGGRFFGGMDKASKTFSGRMSTLADSSKTAMRSIMGIDQEGNVKAGGLFDRLSKALEKLFPVMEKISKNAGPAMEGIMKGIDKAMQFLAPLFMELTKEVTKFWKENKSWLIPVLKALAVLIGGSIVASWALLIGILYAGFKVFNVIRGVIITVIDVVKNMITWFNNAWNTTTTVFNNVKNTIVNAMQAVWNFIEPVVKFITNLFVIQFGAILYVVITILQGIWNVVYSVVSQVYNFWTSIFTAIYNFVSGIWGAIYNVITGVVQSILNFFAPAWNWLYQRGADIIRGLTAGVRAMGGDVYNAIKWAGDKIGAFFSGAGGWLYGVGRAIVQGLVNGIRDMVGAVNSAAGQIGGAVTSKLKGVLGIRSPSRVMHGFGINIAQGLANGIGSGMDKVEAMASNMAVQVKAPMVNPQGMGVQGGNSTSTYTFGDIHIADKQTADYFFAKLNRNNELARKGLATI